MKSILFSKSSRALAASLLCVAGFAAAQSAGQPPVNPYLAAPRLAITHFDSAQSDAFPWPVRRGLFSVDPRKFPRVVAGPVNVMTLASTSPGYMWGVSSEGVSYIDISGGRLREVARMPAQHTRLISAATHAKVLDQPFTSVEQIRKAVSEAYGVDWTRAVNGAYSLVDRDNHVYFNSTNGKISKFGLLDDKHPEAGIRLLKTIDMTPMIGRSFLVGMGMTYDGKFVVASANTLSVLDRSLEGQAYTVRFAPDEVVSNSFCIDAHGGIYVASSRMLHKLVWTGSKLSEDEADGAWKAPYENSQGTGSTPTLMGNGQDADRLVVITDGAARMNLVAFWRDAIPTGLKQIPGTPSARIAGQIPVTAGLAKLPDVIQSRRSVAVSGYGAFVANNAARKRDKDRLVDVLALGPVLPPASGVERFEWDPRAHRWRSVWARGDVVSVSMVPSISTGSGMVFVNGYYPQSGWEITGMDWKTGETVHRVSLGQGNLGNGAYGVVEYLPDGDLLFNSIGGPIRIPLKNARGG
ncbi:hypothetical protein QCE62_27895 [Caballeronia sp. LZ033]|uniref:hypothetical protein n=1 Tax=Caballeronia sp. LZ033 TaxID=3038566 RepID=UPI002865528A|nr:hypothetical protein [Caballeronia sp. LZ033]MDR5817432.1 hypothetical protein [Caballeronia sp. LZ033]